MACLSDLLLAEYAPTAGVNHYNEPASGVYDFKYFLKPCFGDMGL